MAIKNCTIFTNCISQINNTRKHDAEYLDIAIPMYNPIQYSDNYAKTSGSLWHYRKVIPNDNIAASESFKFKARTTGRSSADGNTKNAEIVVPLKDLINFWRTLEMPLINCKINLQLTWSANCAVISSKGVVTFTIVNTRLYVPAVTLSTQGNIKLLQVQQLNSKFKRTGTNI